MKRGAPRWRQTAACGPEGRRAGRISEQLVGRPIRLPSSPLGKPDEIRSGAMIQSGRNLLQPLPDPTGHLIDQRLQRIRRVRIDRADVDLAKDVRVQPRGILWTIKEFRVPQDRQVRPRDLDAGAEVRDPFILELALEALEVRRGRWVVVPWSQLRRIGGGYSALYGLHRLTNAPSVMACSMLPRSA
jgi:hypothetical protein